MDGVDPETLLEWLQTGVADERDLQMMALEQLCMLLLMSDNIDRCFESCPPRTFLPALCKIFTDEHAPDNVLEVTARAITYYLDVSTECTRRIVQVDGAVRAICHRLAIAEMNDRTSRDLAEQCVKVLELMSAREIAAIYEAGGLPCMLTFVQQFAPVVHKDTTHSAMTVVTRLCGKLEPNSPQLAESVTALSALLDKQDDKVADSALKCFATLAERFARRNVDAGVLNENGQLCQRLTGMLGRARETKKGEEEKKEISAATVSTILTILNSMCRSSQTVADNLLEDETATLRALTAVLSHGDDRVLSDGLRFVDLLLLLLTEGRAAINKMGSLVTQAATSGVNEADRVHRAIIDAIRQKDANTVLDLIETNTVDINHTDDVGQTLLNWASAFGNVDMIRRLCEKGADVNKGTRSSSLHYAACFGNAPIARVLLAHGADVTMCDENGMTALQKATERDGATNHADVVKLLNDPPSVEQLRKEMEGDATGATVVVDANAPTEQTVPTTESGKIIDGETTAPKIVTETPFEMNPKRANKYLTALLPLFCQMYSNGSQSMSVAVRRSTLALIRKCTQYIQPDVLASLCTPTEEEEESTAHASDVDEQLLTVVVHVFDEQSNDSESVLSALNILHNLLDTTHAHVWLAHIVRFGVLSRVDKLATAARARDALAAAEDAVLESADANSSTDKADPVKSIDAHTLYAWADWRLMLTHDSLLVWCDAVALELSLASNGWLWYVMDGRLLRLCSNGQIEATASSLNPAAYASRLAVSNGIPAYTKGMLTEKLSMAKAQCTNNAAPKRIGVTTGEEEGVDNAIQCGNWSLSCVKEGELRIGNTCYATNTQCLRMNEEIPGFVFDSCTKQSSTHTAEATLNHQTFATGWANKRGRRARFSREAVRHKVDALAQELWSTHLQHAHSRPRKQYTRLQNAALALRAVGKTSVVGVESALKDLHALMVDDRTVSMYELGSSDLISALQHFLPHVLASGNESTLESFVDIFGGDLALKHLVDKLIGTLESVERLPTYAYDSAGGQFGLQLLSRRLKFRLALKNEKESSAKDAHPRLLDRSGRHMRMEPLCTVGQIRAHILRITAKQWYHFPRASHAYINALRERIPLTLTPTHDFDMNGLLYFIGTNGRTEEDWTNPVTVSCVHITNSDPNRQPYGRPADVISRDAQPINCHSRDDINAWFTIDLGVKLRPSAYTMRHARGYGRSAMRNWQLLGSNDCKAWSPLRHHTADEALMEPGSTHTWTIEGVDESYRYIRIQQMGTNASQQTHYLSVSGFEIYGTVTDVVVDGFGGEAGKEMRGKSQTPTPQQQQVSSAIAQAVQEEAALREMAQQRRTHGMRLRSSLGASREDNASTTASPLRIGDKVSVVKGKGGSKLLCGTRHSTGSGRPAKQGKIVATMKNGRHEVQWENGNRSAHVHTDLALVNAKDAKRATPKASGRKTTTPTGKSRKVMGPPETATSQKTIDKASTTTATTVRHDTKSMSTTNLFDSSDACHAAITVSATGAAASAESLQHQTASLENLLARSRVYEQQRDVSIASTLSTLTSGESIPSMGAGSAHTLDSVPEEIAKAVAEESAAAVTPRPLTIGRAKKHSMARRSSEKKVAKKEPKKEVAVHKKKLTLTVHDAVYNARNAALSKLEPTREGEPPARRDVIVFNKTADGATASSKSSGVCLSGESAATFLEWYDDILRTQSTADSNTTNADDRRAAVHEKINKLLTATEGTPLSHVLMRALGGAATGGAAAAQRTADDDSFMYVDEEEDGDEDEPTPTMDLYDALKQPPPPTHMTSGRLTVDANMLFKQEEAVEDMDDDDDEDEEDHPAEDDDAARPFDYDEDEEENEEEENEEDEDEVEEEVVTTKEEPKAEWRAARTGGGGIAADGSLVTSMPATHTHAAPFMRAYDDDYVLKRVYSALIPAFDPRPGRTNVNQTQDVTVPPASDDHFVQSLPTTSSAVYRQPKVSLCLQLSVNGVVVQQIALEEDDKTVFYYVQRILYADVNKKCGADDKARGTVERRIWDAQYTLVYTPVAPDADVVLRASRESSSNRDAATLDGVRINDESVATLRQVLDVLRDLYCTQTKVRLVDVDASFVSAKITHKLAQQLKEPLIVAADALPEWCSILMCRYAWLFPLATRKSYMDATAYGTCRSIVWLQTQRDAQLSLATARGGARRHEAGDHYAEYRVGRIKHERVRVPRDDSLLLKHAARLLHFHAKRKAVLEIEYEGEEGTGLGPTLEFYALLAAELQRKELGMWLCDDADENETKMEAVDVDLGEGHKPRGFYVRRAGGLFPAPYPSTGDGEQLRGVKEMYHLLGILLGKVLQDGRLLDLPISLPLLKVLCSKEFSATDDEDPIDVSTVLDLDDLAIVHPIKADFLLHLQQLIKRRNAGESESTLTLEMNGHTCHIADLALTFQLNPSSKCYSWKAFDLCADGHDVDVTIENLDRYVAACRQFYLNTGIRAQLTAMRDGLAKVIPLAKLRAMGPTELKTLICGEQTPDWTREELIECTEPKLGFTRESRTFLNLCDVLLEMSGEQRKAFLQFTTGCSSLPPGGLANLHPRLTIVKKVDTGDGSYPSVNTCVHYLKLPDYSTKEVLRERLLAATIEKGFHLA